MVTYEYSKDVSYNYNPDGGISPVCTVMANAADFIAGISTKALHNAARCYIIDWVELDSATKDKVKSQVHMVDKTNERWVPQTAEN